MAVLKGATKFFPIQVIFYATKGKKTIVKFNQQLATMWLSLTIELRCFCQHYIICFGKRNDSNDRSLCVFNVSVSSFGSSHEWEQEWLTEISGNSPKFEIYHFLIPVVQVSSSDF